MQFYERIKQLREQRGWTQSHIASILGISKSTYVKYERGEREPRYGTLIALSELFQVSVDYLLGKSGTDNIYKEQIDKAYHYISSSEFMQEHSEYVGSINKLISNYLKLLYVSNNDPFLDLLYVITEIEEDLMELYRTGLHIFCYDKWAGEDSEFKNVVDSPNKEDLSHFIQITQKVQKNLNDYINILSTESYFSENQLKYKKQIINYSENNLLELITKFHNDPRYKMN